MRLILFTVLVLAVGSFMPAHAQEDENYEPSFWPSVYFGPPEKIAVFINAQQDLFSEERGQPGFNLVESVGIGLGGASIGIGVGQFLEYAESGIAMRAKVLRTYRKPWLAMPNTTYAGLEAEFMFGTIGFKVASMVRISGSDRADRWISTVSIGIGLP